MDELGRWVGLNLAGLVDYWDGNIDTGELLAALKRIRSTKSPGSTPREVQASRARSPESAASQLTHRHPVLIFLYQGIAAIRLLPAAGKRLGYFGFLEEQESGGEGVHLTNLH
jgi:hypothetical protein